MSPDDDVLAIVDSNNSLYIFKILKQEIDSNFIIKFLFLLFMLYIY